MKKILIIEDDLVVANIYRNKFSVEGYSVEIAKDGQTGLELMHGFRPDVVILDLMLPGMTGVDLMKKVRAEPDFQKVPIIVFSNTYLSNLVQDAWKAGATKCLSKANCTPKQLIEVIRGAVARDADSSVLNAAEAKPTGSAVADQPNGTPIQSSEKSSAGSDAHESPTAFLASLAVILTTLRSDLQAMIKADNEAARLLQIGSLYRRIHALTSGAGLHGLTSIAQVADALEALLKELHDKPKNINASTLRTVAAVVDFLGILFEKGPALDQQEYPPAQVLVVDDEAISRRAVTYALEKAKLKAVSVEDPEVAFQLLTQKPFDMVFLDVDMPRMNGFELCAKLRNLPAHKKTPVVFVTGLNDLESRANSMVSGGNDFIAKPFLFIELAVKALVFVMRARVAALKA